MQAPKTVPLNIVMTYPVQWGRYEVLRDFIQNFYDSVGYADWNDALHFEFEGASLSIWIDGVTFSYEWLLHVGASTKTGFAGTHAGYYGEGFKIASLCALRDYHWSVKMASGSWRLTVTDSSTTIDGQVVKMLAYDISEMEDVCYSKLTLGNLDEDDFELFKTVLMSFYYPENPLLGKKIWEGSTGAVYTRGNATYKAGLPCTRDFGRKGIVFCGYQLLGSNPFDLVVCLHNWRQSDRERKALYTFNVVDVFEKIARRIDPDGAILMLEKMRRNWNTTPTRRYDVNSWYPVICNLIDTINRSTVARRHFREKYPNLLRLEPLHTIRERNRRGQARAWLSAQETSYRLVQPAFGRLGYPTLEDACDRGGGFVVDDRPNERENRCFQVLEELTANLYAGFFLQDAMPERKVIRNRKAVYHGMATLYKVHKQQRNNRGITVRYTVGEIYLKECIFTNSGFFDAVATYVHESCHAFGGDSSESFSTALTFAMETLLTESLTVSDFNKQWNEVFATN